MQLDTQSETMNQQDQEQSKSQEQSSSQEQPISEEQSFILPRSAWTRPVRRLRALMQAKRLLDRQEAQFQQHPY